MHAAFILTHARTLLYKKEAFIGILWTNSKNCLLSQHRMMQTVYSIPIK